MKHHTPTDGAARLRSARAQVRLASVASSLAVAALLLACVCVLVRADARAQPTHRPGTNRPDNRAEPGNRPGPLRPGENRPPRVEEPGLGDGNRPEPPPPFRDPGLPDGYEGLADNGWLRAGNVAIADRFDSDSDEEELIDALEFYRDHGVMTLVCFPDEDVEKGAADLTNREFRHFERLAELAREHAPGLHILVVISPTECFTPEVDENGDGRPDRGSDSPHSRHPEWTQVGIDGRPAVFYREEDSWDEWFDDGDEWVFRSPNNLDLRHAEALGLERLARTGVDGVWWTGPAYAHSLGESWSDTWSSFSSADRQKFRDDTGLALPSRVDWNDPLWRSFVDWRMYSLMEFVKEAPAAARSVNREFVVVNHVDGSGTAQDTRLGFSSLLARVLDANDATAHEIFIQDDPDYFRYHDWLYEVALWKLHRALDGDRPCLGLSQSADAEHILLRGAMFAFSGVGLVETSDISPRSSAFRSRGRVFQWLRRFAPELFMPEYVASTAPWADIALWYSPPTVNYVDVREDEDMPSAGHAGELLGLACLLLEAGRQFDILPADEALERLTIDRYRVVILPGVKSISHEEARTLLRFAAHGGTVVATGRPSRAHETGPIDEDGTPWRIPGESRLGTRKTPPAVLAIIQAAETGTVPNVPEERLLIGESGPGAEYLEYARPGNPDVDPRPSPVARDMLLEEFLPQFGSGGFRLLSPDSSPGNPVLPPLGVLSEIRHIVLPDSQHVTIRLLNLSGLEKGEAVPKETEVAVTFVPPEGFVPRTATMFAYPDAAPTGKRLALSYDEETGRCTLLVPKLGAMAIVVVRQ